MVEEMFRLIQGSAEKLLSFCFCDPHLNIKWLKKNDVKGNSVSLNIWMFDNNRTNQLAFAEAHNTSLTGPGTDRVGSSLLDCFFKCAVILRGCVLFFLCQYTRLPSDAEPAVSVDSLRVGGCRNSRSACCSAPTPLN